MEENPTAEARETAINQRNQLIGIAETHNYLLKKLKDGVAYSSEDILAITLNYYDQRFLLMKSTDLVNNIDKIL